MRPVTPHVGLPLRNALQSEQKANAVLISKLLRELSQFPAVKIDKSLIAQLLKDAASVSMIVREVGLLDALIHAVSSDTQDLELLSAIQRLTPQLLDIVPSNIQTHVKYELSNEPYQRLDLNEAGSERAFTYSKAPQHEPINIAMPFTPTKFDFEYTIDDLNRKSMNSDELERAVASNGFNSAEESPKTQSNYFAYNAAFLLSAICIILMLILKIF